MKKRKHTGLDFVIDKLTNSIENVVTGDSFSTDITRISSEEIKTVNTKTAGFLNGKKNSNIPKEMCTN